MAAPGPLRRGIGRIAEPYVFFPLIAVVLLGVVWGMTANLISVEREAAHRAGLASARDLADTYEAQAVRALREIDQALRFVKYAHESSGGRVDLRQLRDKGLLLPEILFAVTLTDAEGRVVAASRAPDMPSYAAADFFTAHRAGGDAIVVGQPREVDGEWKLHFSRGLRGPDGRFAGVAVISVAAAYFVSGYETSKLGQHGVLALLGRDGGFRAGRTGEAMFFGKSVDYRKAVSNDPDPPPALAASSWDGVRRYGLARELFDFPVAVLVGVAEDEQLAAVERHATQYLWRAAAGSALLVLLLGGLGWSSWRLQRTRLAANAALQEEVAIRRNAEAALNLRNRAIESSANAIVIADRTKPGHPIEYVNPAFERITGYSASDVLGRSLEDQIFADGNAVHEVDRALREVREGHAVMKSMRRDGTPVWTEVTLAPVKGEGGAVTHFVGVMNDVTDAKEYEAQLAHQAQYDTLTGLANRNLLRDRLSQAIATARREGGTLATVFLDLDHFKVVNDSLGHTRGDELLRVVAARLTGCVRETDTVARLGGDEFVVVLRSPQGTPDGFESDVGMLVRKLLARVSEPLDLQGRQLQPHCSIGVSLFPQDGEDADTLLRNADAAMYRAKELGRNRFQLFTADMHQRVQRRIEMESSLRRAIERGEFELHYQPQVGLSSGRVVGIEALVRWRHPILGLVGPGQFVPFAEETGLIVPIGEWVLRHACAQNKAWQDAGLPKIPIAVNMSARQLEQPDVADVVRSALSESGLEPKYLELEITESLSMANPEESVPLMKRLKETGVSLSIDDFGTGFSNLSYLCRFPVDRLKIDLSFVRDMTSDPGSLAISEAIITMSHSLNLQVVAEGVETEQQLQMLGARRCDQIQGYFFSPPLQAAPLAELLREDRRLRYQGRFTHPAPSVTM